MAKKKSKFELEIEEISKLNKADDGSVKSSTHSNSVLYKLADAMLNDPDMEVDNIAKKGDDIVTTTSKPTAEFRTGLKKLVKDEFGIDNAEASKLDTCPMPKAVSKAVADMSGALIKGYMNTGKSFRFPMTSMDEARMQISIKDVPESVAATKKVTETSPGKWELVPTGKTIKTKKHKELKTERKLPPWLKEEV